MLCEHSGEKEKFLSPTFWPILKKKDWLLTVMVGLHICEWFSDSPNVLERDEKRSGLAKDVS